MGVQTAQEEGSIQANLVDQLNLPQELKLKITSLGKRCSPVLLDDLILSLCQHQPMTRAEIATVMQRSEDHIRTALRRLLNNQRLEMKYPDKRNHPDQKYLAQKQVEPETQEGM